MSSSLQAQREASIPFIREEEENPDEVLEKMLLEAERLAAKMRSASFNKPANSFASDPPTSPKDAEKKTDSDSEPSLAHSLPKSLEFCTNNLNSQGTLEETSLSSPTEDDARSSSSSHHTIEAAIKAAKEMELALKALGATTPESPNASPLPASPKEMMSTPQKETTTTTTQEPKQPTTTNTTPKEANAEKETQWEKVDMARKGDEDYVAIADYSIKTPPTTRKVVNGVTWEKMSFVEEKDEDYVPLADYTTRSSPVMTERNIRTKTLRSSRKKRRRRKLIKVAALVMFLLLVLAGWFLWARGALEYSEKDVFEETMENDAVPASEVFYVDYEMETIDNCSAEEPDVDKEIGDYEKSVTRNEKRGCHMPLAFLIMPHCHEQMSRPERLDAVLQSMME